MGTRHYDVIVVGASFAGLAVVRELRGEVLLIDRHEVGSHQTSTCGTPLWVSEALGVVDSVLQVHRRVVVHAPSRTVTFDVTDTPYCTFDYGKFCRGLLDQCRVRFLRATVTGVAESVVETTEGRFAAPCVVDCSGWQGALTPVGTVRRTAMSFGLETDTEYSAEALYCWARPQRFGGGIAWLFPTGRGSGVGLGSYRGTTKLKGALTRFVDDLAAAPGAYHGAYLPSGLGAATAGRMFVVGDAAGHCLPLTAEGIRPALHFGQECGRLVQRVLDGTSPLHDALAAYRRRVEAYRWAYRALALAQWATRTARLARRDGRTGCAARRYGAVVAPVLEIRRPPAAPGCRSRDWRRSFRIRRDGPQVRTRITGRGSWLRLSALPLAEAQPDRGQRRSSTDRV